MFCSNCGTQAREAVSFCSNCGAKIANGNTAEPQTEKKKKSKVPILVLLTVLVVAISFVVFCFIYFPDSSTLSEYYEPAGTYTYKPRVFGISTGIEVSLRFTDNRVVAAGDINGIGLGFEAGTFYLDDDILIIVGSNGIEVRGTYSRDNDVVKLIGFEFTKR